MATVSVRLTDIDGKLYRWTIRRVPRAIHCDTFRTRVISGWEFIDHDSYTRFSEGNWFDVVAAVRATANNYGLTLLSALS